VNKGEILALIGRNGAGKTSAIKAIMGLMPKATGEVRFAGQDLLSLPPACRGSD
jgi:branched-chain amino acid transport system ATP-binding protein